MKNMVYKIQHPLQAGFTLVEILVAVTILAISMGALISSSTGFVKDAALLRDRYIASLVAQNRIAEMRLELRLESSLPNLGTDYGAVQMAGNNWKWETTTQKTFDMYGVVVLNTKVQISSAVDSKNRNIFSMNAYFSKGS